MMEGWALIFNHAILNLMYHSTGSQWYWFGQSNVFEDEEGQARTLAREA